MGRAWAAQFVWGLYKGFLTFAITSNNNDAKIELLRICNNQMK